MQAEKKGLRGKEKANELFERKQQRLRIEKEKREDGAKTATKKVRKTVAMKPSSAKQKRVGVPAKASSRSGKKSQKNLAADEGYGPGIRMGLL